ncbi:MAG TPA: iron ABC transporter substrate-binding protein, partial [Methanocorpusculum sp.]|nr:iron ABC transporter substrate-binding protein [Methanocorpusculum sp.]
MNVCRRSLAVVLGCIFAVLLCLCAGCVSTPETPTEDAKTITVTDAFGREVTIPDNPQKIAVSGSGS